MKKLSSLILAVILIFGVLVLPISAKEEVNVVLNGFIAKFDIASELISGRTMVPLRKFAEYIGADVTWVGETREVILTRGEDTVIVSADSPELYKNGELLMDMDVSPIIVRENGESYTLAPVRAISEAFGLTVDWDSTSSTAYVIDINEDTVMSVGLFPISADMLDYYYNDTVRFLTSDPEFSINSETIEMLPELVCENIYAYAAILDTAARLGYTFYSQTEIDAVNASLESYKSHYGDSFAQELENSNMTEEIFRTFLFTSLFQNGMMSELESLFYLVPNEDKIATLMGSPELLRTAHILVSDIEVAETILEEAQNASDEEFFALMDEYTEDTAVIGDRVGYYSLPGMMVSAYESAAYGLTPGETSGIVESEYGYHIIRRLEAEANQVETSIDMLFAYYLESQYYTSLSLAAERMKLSTVFYDKYYEFDFTSAFE